MHAGFIILFVYLAGSSTIRNRRSRLESTVPAPLVFTDRTCCLQAAHALALYQGTAVWTELDAILFVAQPAFENVFDVVLTRDFSMVLPVAQRARGCLASSADDGFVFL